MTDDFGKALLRRVVPHGRRAELRALYNRATWWMYAGRKVTCNCCGGHFRRFRVYSREGHRALMCPRCGSLGRHRVDWLYLTEHTDALSQPVRVLHVAPEVCLETPLRRLPGVSYLSADYDSTLAMDQVDLRSIQYQDESFDGVICNHVLQLIDEDERAMAELHRIVRTGGWALLQSSVDPSLERTIENHAPPEQDSGRYEEVFMRRYGRDYGARLEQAGFDVTVSDFARELPPEVQQRLGLDLDETIFFCRKREPATNRLEASSERLEARPG